MEAQFPAILILSLFVGALLVPVGGSRAKRWPYAVAVIGTAVAFAVSLAALVHVLKEGALHYHFAGWLPPVGIEFVLDPLAAFFCVLINGVALCVLWHGRTVVRRETPGREVPFYAAVLLLLGGLCGILLTGDLFNLYVFLEISSIATYALVAVGGKQAPVAAFRYLILGTIGASFYLLGVGFIFMATGSLNMADVSAILEVIGQSRLTLTGLVLVTLGLGLKMALFPLHMWLPDAYTFASSTASALVAAIGTKVPAYALIRILYYVHDAELINSQLPLADIILYLGAAGILWGGLMAMAQTDLKRMLAFSSVGHVGYIAVGVGLASPIGLAAALLHILNHAIMKGCLFLISGNLVSKVGHTSIARLDNSVGARMPWSMLALTITAISMIGLPPTIGFFSKWYLIMGVIGKGYWPLVIVIILSSLFSVVYFFRILEKVYLKSPDAKAGGKKAPVKRDEVSPSMLAPVMLLSVSLLVIGLSNFLIFRHVIVPMLPPGWNL